MKFNNPPMKAEWLNNGTEYMINQLKKNHDGLNLLVRGYFCGLLGILNEIEFTGQEKEDMIEWLRKLAQQLAGITPIEPEINHLWELIERQAKFIELRKEFIEIPEERDILPQKREGKLGRILREILGGVFLTFGLVGILVQIVLLLLLILSSPLEAFSLQDLKDLFSTELWFIFGLIEGGWIISWYIKGRKLKRKKK